VCLIELKDCRLRELESEMARRDGRAAERERRCRSSLVAERNERNALEIDIQQQAARIAQQYEEKLADEVERMAAESRSLSKRIAAKEQQHQQNVTTSVGLFAIQVDHEFRAV
jgi:hypothetical protein